MSTSPERLHALLGLMAASGQSAHAAVVERLEAAFGPIEAWWRRRDERLVDDPSCAALRAPGLDRTAEDAHRVLSGAGWRAVEPGRHAALASVPDPPPSVFLRGPAALPNDGAAVVGARRASAYGLRMTSRLAEGLAAEGVAVVSGLARGIDAAAHRACLRAGGVTVAVLGAGPTSPIRPNTPGCSRRSPKRGLCSRSFSRAHLRFLIISRAATAS
jgi:predicted Rossmann fold nucleotide-binding protein DprA/Smf involved in DNA uptake